MLLIGHLLRMRFGQGKMALKMPIHPFGFTLARKARASGPKVPPDMKTIFGTSSGSSR
jgi:hypothetical protein